MDNYDLFQKRLKTSVGISLKKLEEDKIKTFKIALQRGYNRELFIKDSDNIEFMCLVSGINTQPTIEKKSFSTLLENNCMVGDTFLWQRRNSHWMITDVEETEKSIFQGYISQALYHLKWINPETGNIYSSWACTKGPEETTIPDGVKHSIRYDNLNQSLYLMMPKNIEGMDLLDRYYEIFVNGRKWIIQSADRYSYENLITIQLLETSINLDDDVKNEIADGKIPFNYLFSCSLDGVEFLKLNQEIELSFFLHKNENTISNLVPTITTKNCLYIDNKIIFDSLGEAIITFHYPDINKTYQYMITVTEESISEEVKRFIGPQAAKTMTSAEYTFEYILNGEQKQLDGIWKFDSNFFTIVSSNKNYIKLKARNKIGITQIVFQVKNEDGSITEYKNSIKVTSIYEGS